MLSDLPYELLIKIFSVLPPRDILTQTLVCKRFNEIISDNVKLLSQFQIEFNDEYKDLEWTGSRMYSNVMIEIKKIEFDHEKLESIKDSVQHLEVKCCENPETTLKIILACPNLKSLCLSRCHIKEGDLGGFEIPNGI